MSAWEEQRFGLHKCRERHTGPYMGKKTTAGSWLGTGPGQALWDLGRLVGLLCSKDIPTQGEAVKGCSTAQALSLASGCCWRRWLERILPTYWPAFHFLFLVCPFVCVLLSVSAPEQCPGLHPLWVSDCFIWLFLPFFSFEATV